MAKPFADRFSAKPSTSDISVEGYRAFKAGSKKRLSFKITKTGGTIHVIPFCYLLPFKVSIDQKKGRTICTFAAGPVIVALMMENFSSNDIDRFLDALGENEMEAITEWDSKLGSKQNSDPYFSQILISEPKLEVEQKS